MLIQERENVKIMKKRKANPAATPDYDSNYMQRLMRPSLVTRLIKFEFLPRVCACVLYRSRDEAIPVYVTNYL